MTTKHAPRSIPCQFAPPYPLEWASGGIALRQARRALIYSLGKSSDSQLKALLNNALGDIENAIKLQDWMERTK